MNLLDLLILCLVLMAVGHGVLLGAAVQALSFGGFWLGLTAGAALAPRAAGLAGDPALKAAVSLLAVFGLAVLAGGLGREVGVRIWGRVRRAGLGWLDSALGALLAGVATLLASWLAASTLAAAPVAGLATAVHGSAVVRALDRVLPPAPSVFSRIQRLIEAQGLPQVFAQLEPEAAPSLPDPGPADVRAALQRAGDSTVRIEGAGCGGVQTGSGFVAAPGLVVTNAHVVAGIDSPLVIGGGARHRATPVLFDPDLDIAVLRVRGLAAAPLPLLGRTVGRGATGAVLGYPGGGRLQALPAAVLNRYQAVGRDIYGRGLARRTVYEVQAAVRPGNSGGPLVDAEGVVMGVVFSRSVRQAGVGYAVTSTDVGARVEQAQRLGGLADTGPCAA